jgi:MFS family permease
MSDSTTLSENTIQKQRGLAGRSILIAREFAWTSIIVGAIAMAATYPGRTHGLGMVTEPLLKDFRLDSDNGRVLYATLGFWATILGAIFCIPVGWLLDRIGQRWVLFGNMSLLGLSVLLLSFSTNLSLLFVGLLLTRGFGQAALSVVSITVVSNSHAPSRLGMAMAFYAILGMPLHLVLIAFVGWALNTVQLDWRVVWGLVGFALIVVSWSAWLLPAHAEFRTSRFSDLHVEPQHQKLGSGYTMLQALRTPAFWLFSMTISIWGMIYAGTALFNQDIFRERGFESDLYFKILSLTTIVALVSKLAFGWMMNYVRMTHLLGCCLLLSAVSLAGLPFATKIWHAYAYGIVLGIASGAVALLFFAVWGKLYGRGELGQIQGVAQMMTVFASAAGPLVFSMSKRMTSSYTAIFFIFAVTLALMGVIAIATPLPRLLDQQNET